MHATASVESGADGTTGIHTGEEHDLRCFQEDAARRGDRNGRRSRAGSGLGVGDNAAAACADAARCRRRDTRHAGRQRARISPGGRARAPRGLRLRASLSAEATVDWVLETGAAIRSTDPSSMPHEIFNSERQIVDGCVYADLGVREGRRRIHQAHRLATRRRQNPTTLREAVHRRLDGAPQADGHAVAATSTPATSAAPRSTRSRRSRSACSGRTRTAAHPTARRSAAPHQDHRQGQPPAGGRLQRVGPRRSPDAARRLGQVGGRRGALDERPQSAPTAITQLGHPRRLADRPRVTSITSPLGASARRRLEDDLQPTSTRSTTAPDAVRRRTGGFSTVFGTCRPPRHRSARSIRSIRATRCCPTARSTRVTRRCRPRRST